MRRYSAILILLAVGSGLAAQGSPQEKQAGEAADKEKSIVLVGNLSNHKITESFQFPVDRFPEVSDDMAESVRFPLIQGELILRAIESPMGRYKMIYRRQLQPDDPLIDDLESDYEIKNRIVQVDGVKKVRVIATRTFEFTSLKQFRKKHSAIYRQFSNELLFFDALQVFSKLRNFQIVQTP